MLQKDIPETNRRVLDIPLHSVIVTVGPTKSGKTTWARELRARLISSFDAIQANVPYISTDEMRWNMIGRSDLDRSSPPMIDASAAAFKAAYATLDALLSQPIAPEYVVLDSTGLGEEFQARVKEICDRHGFTRFLVLFDFRKYADFFLHAQNMTEKKTIQRQITRMRENYRLFPRPRYTVKNLTATPDLSLKNRDLYQSCFLRQQCDYVIIGDVHEDVVTLQKIMDATAKHHPVYVLVGDFLDLKEDYDRDTAIESTKRIVEFLHEHLDRFEIVMGNHEYYHWRRMRQTERGWCYDMDPDGEKTAFFSARHALNEDAQVRERLARILGKAKPFLVNDTYRLRDVILEDDTKRPPPFVVTHAPCEVKYVARCSEEAVRRQRYYQRPGDEDQLLAYMKAIRLGTQHLRHIFGHTQWSEPYVDGGLIGLDVTGDRLAYCTAAPCRDVVGAVTVKWADGKTVGKRNAHVRAAPAISPEDEAHIRRMADNVVNYLSGTMPPSEADADDLEPVRTALAEFKRAGQDEVCLQMKFMGSRCQIYLNMADTGQSYAVSRNGYVIRNVGMEELFSTLVERHMYVGRQHNARWIIMDGELMPWRALGAGLVDDLFQPIADALSEESAALREAGFYDRVLPALRETVKGTHLSSTPYTELSDSFGGATTHIVAAGRLLNDVLQYSDAESHAAAAGAFVRQVQQHGAPAPLDFEAFRLLKIIRADGQETLGSDLYRTTSENFAAVSRREFVVCKTSDVAAAEKFFARVTGSGMEGIVVKPQIASPDIVPHIKVRGAEYLTLVYGYDYREDKKARRLIQRKKVGAKTKLAVTEFAAAEEMLAVPRRALSAENEEYVRVVSRILDGFHREESLDPAL